jgi:squalene-hopene/tetraprenyl-beta-curcumene cyclase
LPDGIAAQSVPASSLDASIEAALRWLGREQDTRGFWSGVLESNCCIEAEWLLAFHVLGYRHPASARIVRGILDRQRGDGSWETYYEAPGGDINATVECYAALRACGIPAEAEPLRRARGWILEHGGLRRIRVFTRYWLALIGEWPWEATPNLPPEIIRFPDGFAFSIYSFASWARATLVPLCVLSARRHCVPLPVDRRLDELFPGGRDAFDYSLPARGNWLSWSGFFRTADRLLHRLQDLSWTPGRRAAVSRCLEWIVRHQDADGAWGGIQPPWIYSVMALHAEGYGLDHPVVARSLGALDSDWSYARGEGLRIQASESPVWDTALALLAIADCGAAVRMQAGLQRGIEWLLRQEVRTAGDWSVRVRDAEPGAWAFERANVHYPDVDDTAVVMMVLKRLGSGSPPVDAAVERARQWLLAMQCRNGGWAAFDRDNDRRVLTKIPFCDFGETIDPPSVDVTAHVLEALGALGMDRQHPAVARGLTFIRREQEIRGSWFGRWGVNHIYGTSAVLQALRAIGEDMGAGYVRRAARWLADCQNPDGGWGESCASYMDPVWIGRGASTASQTGWAVLGLLAVSAQAFRLPIARGVGFLVATQRGGTWDEPWYTGTGFPGYGVGTRLDLGDRTLAQRLNQGVELQRGFMINYSLYRHYFPLAALGRTRQAGIAPALP